tara:strand:- start:198 stop:413 length:216 start_codon:yes stop_codon:yes gene_type:complete
MKDSLPAIQSKMVLQFSLALLLAVRCRQKDAAKQLLAKIYHDFSEQQAKVTMNRLIYLLEPLERDWMRDLV